MFAVAAIIDKDRLKRLEQQLRGVIKASSSVALLAHDASQFLQNKVAAGNFIATQNASLKFTDQQRTRSRRKAREEISVISRRSFRRPPFSVYPNPSPSA